MGSDVNYLALVQYVLQIGVMGVCLCRCFAGLRTCMHTHGRVYREDHFDLCVPAHLFICRHMCVSVHLRVRALVYSEHEGPSKHYESMKVHPSTYNL